MGKRWLLVAVLVFGSGFVAGCDPLDHDEFTRRVQTLESIAAEGSLLADDVARDRTKITFIRAHSEELALSAHHEGEKIHDSRVSPEYRKHRRRAMFLATAIEAAFDKLRVAPGNPPRAERLKRKFDDLVMSAKTLEDSL